MNSVRNFFEDSELAYRRMLSVKAIADEIVGSALDVVGIKDKVPYSLVCDHIDIAVKDFIHKLEQSVENMAIEYPPDSN